MSGAPAFRNLLLAAGSLAATLGALDLGFRVSPPENLQVNNPYRYTKMIGGLKAGVPLASYIEVYPLEYDPRGYYRKSRGGIFYFMDQFGGRWTEAAVRRLKKRVGILLGDSLTYGFGVRFEDTFGYLLAREPSFRMDLVNLARPEADARGALEVYEKKGSKIPHELVIYGLHLNDLIPFPTSYVATNEKIGYAADRSPFAGFVLQKWDAVFGRPRRIRELTDPGAMERPYFRDNFAAILELARLTKAARARFYVAILPVLVDLRRETFAPVYERIARELRRNGIEVIDLTTGLSGYQDQALWIAPFDQHPNEVANEIFAERLRWALPRR